MRVIYNSDIFENFSGFKHFQIEIGISPQRNFSKKISYLNDEGYFKEHPFLFYHQIIFTIFIVVYCLGMFSQLVSVSPR